MVVLDIKTLLKTQDALQQKNPQILAKRILKDL